MPRAGSCLDDYDTVCSFVELGLTRAGREMLRCLRLYSHPNYRTGTVRLPAQMLGCVAVALHLPFLSPKITGLVRSRVFCRGMSRPRYHHPRSTVTPRLTHCSVLHTHQHSLFANSAGSGCNSHVPEAVPWTSWPPRVQNWQWCGSRYNLNLDPMISALLGESKVAVGNGHIRSTCARSIPLSFSSGRLVLFCRDGHEMRFVNQ